jgi:hypothetical protein
MQYYSKLAAASPDLWKIFAAGRLDGAVKRADDHYEAGGCTPFETLRRWFWIRHHPTYERLLNSR